MVCLHAGYKGVIIMGKRVKFHYTGDAENSFRVALGGLTSYSRNVVYKTINNRGNPIYFYVGETGYLHVLLIKENPIKDSYYLITDNILTGDNMIKFYDLLKHQSAGLGTLILLLDSMVGNEIKYS